jgi:hypothetical protein
MPEYLLQGLVIQVRKNKIFLEEQKKSAGTQQSVSNMLAEVAQVLKAARLPWPMEHCRGLETGVEMDVHRC